MRVFGVCRSVEDKLDERRAIRREKLINDELSKYVLRLCTMTNGRKRKIMMAGSARSGRRSHSSSLT